MAMRNTPGCAFSLPPSAAIGRAYGDHRVLPLPHTVARSHSINAQQVPRSTSQREWQTLAYRPRHRLEERRAGRRGRQQRQQQSVDRNGVAEDREGEASPRQPQQQRQQVEERVLLPPSATAQSPTIAAQDEDVVILNDPFEELEGDRRGHPCVVHNALAAGPTPYNDGWEWQKQTLARLAERPNDLSSADAEPDYVLLTQHDAVFTLGTGSTLDNLRFQPDDAPFGEVVRTERGGEVTYHGPGQIVMYPIMNLRRYRQDIHWYLRALEETVIRTLARLGLKGERVEGLTGVWVEGHKVAAVGVRVKRWITMHGLSLNVRPDLEHFKYITPCGISDRPVGSLEQLCAEDEDASLERVGRLLLESFEEVFGVSAAPAAESGPPSSAPSSSLPPPSPDKLF